MAGKRRVFGAALSANDRRASASALGGEDMAQLAPACNVSAQFAAAPFPIFRPGLQIDRSPRTTKILPVPRRLPKV